jgi:hypothetical protein
MNAEENITLMGINLQLAKLAESVGKLRPEAGLSAWVSLKQAAALKGGGAYATYRVNPILQPCCGRNSTLVCGVKCWKATDVLEWLEVTDAGLKEYAARWGAALPEIYERRSKRKIA